MERRKTFIVTGGNQGLGFECAKNLAVVPGAIVVLACRGVESGEQAARILRDQGADVRVLRLDLASLASIRSFADRLSKDGLTAIDGLVCNAGVQEVQAPSKTEDGFETTFGVNHLGHFLLVQLLLPSMTSGSRIAVVSSGTHDPATKSGLPEPRYTTAREVALDLESGSDAGRRRYSTSKLCNVYFTYELARRLAGSGDARLRSIRVNAFDPGLMPGTGLARQYPPFLRFLWNYFLPVLILLMKNVNTTRTSGRRLAGLIVDPGLQTTGKYFSEGKEAPSSKVSYDEANARDLWDGSMTLAGLS